MMDRETQIKLMQGAEERTIGYVRNWLKNREFKDALHRYDDDKTDGNAKAYAR